MRQTLVSVLLLVVLPSCIVEAPTSEKSAAVSARTGKPAGLKNGAVLGEVAELAGATFLPASVAPGEATRITLYFRPLQATTEDWQLFVHVEDTDGQGERINVDHAPRRPTSSWRPGVTEQDDFVIALPTGWRSRAVNVWVGMWLPRTNARIPVKNPAAVRTDGQDRVLLAQLPVEP